MAKSKVIKELASNHRYLSVLFLISCQVPIYSSGGTGMYTIFRGIILRYLTLS